MHSIVNLTKNIAKCKLKNSLTCKHDKYEYGSDRYPAVAAAEVVAAAVATATNQFQLATAKFAYFPIVLGPACSTILFHLNSGASPAALPVCRRSVANCLHLLQNRKWVWIECCPLAKYARQLLRSILALHLIALVYNSASLFLPYFVFFFLLPCCRKVE